MVEGPIDGESFRTYVARKVLVPTLREGDINVIMDNLNSHKSKAVRALIRAAGAKLLFLPKYSPDLNPIEQVFAETQTPVAKKPPHEPPRSNLRRDQPNPRNLLRNRNAPTTSRIQAITQPRFITL